MDRKKLTMGKYAAAAALGIALGVTGFKACSVLLERTPAHPPAQSVNARNYPRKGDGRCEASRGEANPDSSIFDLASCGYCGDGIPQQWETPAACPVDFTCGNGRLESHEIFSAYRLQEGRLVLSKREVTESCLDRSPLYCARDCASPSALPECPNSTRRPLILASVDKVFAIKGRFRSAVSAAGEDIVRVTISGRVSPDGRIEEAEVSASMKGAPYSLVPGGLAAEVAPVKSSRLPSPGEECSFGVRVSIPADRVK